MPEGDPIRIIPHRAVDCGSLEVWFADGRASVRFYWDNLVSRRLRPSLLTREQVVEKATALARNWSCTRRDRDDRGVSRRGLPVRPRSLLTCNERQPPQQVLHRNRLDVSAISRPTTSEAAARRAEAERVGERQGSGLVEVFFGDQDWLCTR
jgi:hypothetical protein